MTIQNGTVWNKYINANYEEVTVDSQRSMLRAFDFLTGTIKVLDTALTTPPITPANGDAYCVLTGAVAPWTNNTFQVWRTGVTSGITNDPVAPFWESYSLAEGVTFFSANDVTHYQVNAGLTISTFGGGNPFDQDLNTTDSVEFVNLELSGGVITNPTADGDILLQVDDAGTARLKTTSPSGRIALTLENNDAVFAGFLQTFMAYRVSKITLTSLGIVIDGDGSAPVTIKSSGVDKINVLDATTTIQNDLALTTGVMNAPTGLEIQAYGVQKFTAGSDDLNLWRKATSEAVLASSNSGTTLYNFNTEKVFEAVGAKTAVLFGEVERFIANASNSQMVFDASNYISTDATGTTVKGNFFNEVGSDARIITNNVGVTLYGGAGTKQIEVNQFGAYVTGGMNIENGNDGNVTSGVYTPTITGLTNFTSGTAFSTTFLRVGNSIHIGGRIDVVPTGAGLVQFYISLPVNCTISDGSQASGVATNLSTAYYPFTLLGINQPNGAILFEGAVLGGGNQVFFFNAIYRVAI